MALDPNPRILSGNGIARNWQNNRVIVVRATASFTSGVEVTELFFPDPAIGFVIPRLGTISLQLSNRGQTVWTDPVDLRLTQVLLPVVPERLDLVAIALIPNVGCQLDAESALIQ